MVVVNAMIHMLTDVENDKVCIVILFGFWTVTCSVLLSYATCRRKATLST